MRNGSEPGSFGSHQDKGDAKGTRETHARELTENTEILAERVGFEPTVRFPVRSLSRRVLSTAQSPLRRYFSS
jgi:hypothetical protein